MMAIHWLAKKYIRAGVTSGASSVVHEVIVTESATSPRARNVTKFEAVPPGTQPRSIRPTAKSGGSAKALQSATGHDRELGEDAEEDVAGTAEDFTEVGRREREPHAEHHDAEENRNPAANGLEHVRENKTQYPRNNHPQRKGLVGEAAKHK